MKKHAKPPLDANVIIEYLPSPWPARFTQMAFILSLAIVIARATMSETLRDFLEVIPGGDIAARGAGPTSGLALDLLTCVPALLILTRRVVERSGYTLRTAISHILIALFAIWALLSGRWASDKFAAIVTSFHFVAAAVFIWSTSQLVRSWMRLRIVAGVCFGLLLVYCAHGMIHKFVDVPDNIRFWNEHKAELLAERGMDGDSYAAHQLEINVTRGAMLGFGASPNTFATVIVTLIIIAAGVIAQRRANDNEPAWSIIVALAFIPAIFILWLTGSKTSFVTLIIGLGTLIAIAKLRPWLAEKSRRAYLVGVGAVILAAIAVVSHGLVRHSLPGASLNFRWRYWVGAMKVFIDHPFAGVGWSNFGNAYLAHRLPAASEEIRDPHNFIIRAFVELGFIGGALMIAWLGRFWWEITRPIAPPPAPSESGRKTSGKMQLLSLAAVAVIAIGLNLLCSVDWSKPQAFLILEVARRALFLGLIFVGAAIVALRSFKQQTIDDRPAPWILYGIIAAIGVFLIHNMLDFALAESGPLMVFALLAGAALGARMPVTAKLPHRGGAMFALAIALLLWIGAALSVVIPVADAEEQARNADIEIVGRHPDRAASMLSAAYSNLPVNADYAYRAARALIMSNGSPVQIRGMLRTATAADPLSAQYWLMLGRFEKAQQPPNTSDVIGAYDRAMAIDPNSLLARIDYAETLDALGRAPQAAEQYHRALAINDGLEPADPKRLSPEKLDQIQKLSDRH